MSEPQNAAMEGSHPSSCASSRVAGSPSLPHQTNRANLLRLPWWWALICAALGGLLLDLASPEHAWWPASLLGIVCIAAAVWQQRARFGLLVGFVAGVAFWLPHIGWLTLYLGPIPWLALSGAMIFWFVLFGAAAAAATRGIGALCGARPGLVFRSWPVPGAFAQALAFAGLWVVREQLQGSVPYGGFAWGRVAHTQVGGPFEQAVSWLGFAGLTGAVTLVAALLVAALFVAALCAADRGAARRTARRVAPLMVLSAAVAVTLVMLPAAVLPTTGELRVAAVQGNSDAAIFDDRESGAVLRDHLDGTEALLDELESSGESVDVIVWPENSAEYGLPEQPLASHHISRLATRAEAPIVVGAILRDPDDTYTNSSLVWVPGGDSGLRYDKRYPVPFAEYMPHRDFYHSLVPDLVELVQLEYAAGTRPAVFDVATAAGDVRVGLAICFDIIFDPQADAMVAADAGAGAEVIFAQTNNADFGHTDQSAQQLAIAHLRAVETGRALVNISTVGTSAVVLPTGERVAELEPFTADSMVVTVPLVTGHTPATQAGSAIAIVWCVIGLTGLAAAPISALAARPHRDSFTKR